MNVRDALRRMLAPRRPAASAVVASIDDQLELIAARERVERKWAAMDKLVKDFRRGDDRLRLARR
jgi:hypothetical protein